MNKIKHTRESCWLRILSPSEQNPAERLCPCEAEICREEAAETDPSVLHRLHSSREPVFLCLVLSASPLCLLVWPSLNNRVRRNFGWLKPYCLAEVTKHALFSCTCGSVEDVLASVSGGVAFNPDNSPIVLGNHFVLIAVACGKLTSPSKETNLTFTFLPLGELRCPQWHLRLWYDLEKIDLKSLVVMMEE